MVFESSDGQQWVGLRKSIRNGWETLKVYLTSSWATEGR